jgi:periplasmic protein TorT
MITRLTPLETGNWKRSDCGEAFLVQQHFWLQAQCGSVAQENWPVDAWNPPFEYRGEPRVASYIPLSKSSKPWRICASYPHLKDSYWLSVNYGMVERARRLGIKLRVVEAGGYPNLDRQKAQIADCAQVADALIIGTVSYDGLTPLIRELSKKMPVIAAVNDIASEGITAKSGVSWVTMGAAIGDYFATLHPKSSPPVKVAWFPGPTGAGWVKFRRTGLQACDREEFCQSGRGEMGRHRL